MRWGGNRLAYWERGLVSDRCQTSVMSQSLFSPMQSPCHHVMSDAQCHFGCTVLTEIHVTESGPMLVGQTTPLMFSLCTTFLRCGNDDTTPRCWLCHKDQLPKTTLGGQQYNCVRRAEHGNSGIRFLYELDDPSKADETHPATINIKYYHKQPGSSAMDALRGEKGGFQFADTLGFGAVLLGLWLVFKDLYGLTSVLGRSIF